MRRIEDDGRPKSFIHASGWCFQVGSPTSVVKMFFFMFVGKQRSVGGEQIGGPDWDHISFQICTWMKKIPGLKRN